MCFLGLKMMEQVTHTFSVLNHLHLFSHLSIVHIHKLAETSWRWGTVYHNNMLPTLFLPLSHTHSLSLSLSLSFLLYISFFLKPRQPVVVFAIWCGTSVEAAERRILLPCRSIRLYAWRKAPAEMPTLCKESWERNTCRRKEKSKSVSISENLWCKCRLC